MPLSRLASKVSKYLGLTGQTGAVKDTKRRSRGGEYKKIKG